MELRRQRSPSLISWILGVLIKLAAPICSRLYISMLNLTELMCFKYFGGSLTKIVTEGVRNLSGWQWKPYNSWRGVCHVLQSHLGQGTLVTTFKLLKWNVHHVRVDQTFKCPVRTTILTKFLKRRHDLDWRHYKTNCLNGMRFSEYRHWISLGALKKQIGSGWLVFLP